MRTHVLRGAVTVAMVLTMTAAALAQSIVRGKVSDAQGKPVEGATVTLFRSDSAAGPFTVVPNGSTIMSPEKTVALVPSENVAVSVPQSSTSTGLALRTVRSSGRRHAVTLPTSQVTLATLIASPRAFASTCLR